MPGGEFEIVDNDKRQLARHSLERLKALAPTFAEGSSRRLACMELIAEREQAALLEAQRTALRRSTAALVVSLVALAGPPGAFVAWWILKPAEPLPQRVPAVEGKTAAVPRPLPKPPPSPSPFKAPPLPSSLSEPPVAP